MRRFYMQRNKDVSGLSGTGIVAEGVVFTNGFVALTWLTPLQSGFMATKAPRPSSSSMRRQIDNS